MNPKLILDLLQLAISLAETHAAGRTWRIFWSILPGKPIRPMKTRRANRSIRS